MFVSDKKIIKVFAEPGQMDNCPDDPYTVSSADTVLDYLKMSSK
jgi:peroxiredoxin